MALFEFEASCSEVNECVVARTKVLIDRRQTRAPAVALILRWAGSLDDIKALTFVIRYFSLVISYLCWNNTEQECSVYFGGSFVEPPAGFQSCQTFRENHKYHCQFTNQCLITRECENIYHSPYYDFGMLVLVCMSLLSYLLELQFQEECENIHQEI